MRKLQKKIVFFFIKLPFKVTQGGMAEYMIYPSKALVHVVPSDMDPFHAAFVEPLACSLHAVELGKIQVTLLMLLVLLLLLLLLSLLLLLMLLLLMLLLF